MNRYVAFLRGINLGNRRITNPELCAVFETMGFANVAAFLASGNIVFDAPSGTITELAGQIETTLAASLGYQVPTFLRTAEEVRAIAAHEAFTEERLGSPGKVQVALLSAEPGAAARAAVLAFATDEDLLELRGRELYWLPQHGVGRSALDMPAIEKITGTTTVRTKRTVERIVAKYLAG